MKQLIFILLACVCLFSCKSPQKAVSSSKVNQETNISNDISSSDENRVQELTDQIIKRLISERLDVGVKNIKYDTEKPVDSITGKHPVSEETEINIRRETEVNETDSIHQETDSVSTTNTKGNSQIAVKTKTETKESKETGLSGLQKKLIAVGVFSIIGFIVFIIIKIKK
jgi:hypothetical protein